MEDQEQEISKGEKQGRGCLWGGGKILAVIAVTVQSLGALVAIYQFLTGTQALKIHLPSIPALSLPVITLPSFSGIAFACTSAVYFFQLGVLLYLCRWDLKMWIGLFDVETAKTKRKKKSLRPRMYGMAIFFSLLLSDVCAAWAAYFGGYIPFSGLWPTIVFFSYAIFAGAFFWYLFVRFLLKYLWP